MAGAWALLLPWASHAAAEAGGRPDFPWAVVYGIGHLVCHQRPERSFMWADAPWPVCARCAGIYAGAALGALAGAVSGRGWRPWPPARVRLAIGLALLPAGLSLGYEWSTGAMPSHTVRATTGWLHLHFDHAGGFTVRGSDGVVRPRFPRARHVVQRGEWEDATHPHERNRASYVEANFRPLADAGLLTLVDGDETVAPGIRVERTPGHTAHHQSVWIASGGESAVFIGDLIPTTAHVPEPWIMGYDLHPVDTLMSKKRLLQEAEARRALLLFEHDATIAAGRVQTVGGKRHVEPVSLRT